MKEKAREAFTGFVVALCFVVFILGFILAFYGGCSI